MIQYPMFIKDVCGVISLVLRFSPTSTFFSKAYIIIIQIAYACVKTQYNTLHIFNTTTHVKVEG